MSRSENCLIPTLHAVSAIGTCIRFYSLDVTAPEVKIVPLPAPGHPTQLNGSEVARDDQWSYDILEADGQKKLCDIFEEIKRECAGLH